MSKRFFGDIGPVRFEGAKSDNPYAYSHYDPSRVVMGKTMAEQLQARGLLLAQLRLDWAPTCSARRPSSAPGTARR